MIIHHASREQVEDLFDVFAESRVEVHDMLTWEVPEWLVTMWETAKEHHEKSTKT